MKTLPESDIEKLKIRKDIVTGIPEVMCFVDDMNDFFDVSIAVVRPSQRTTVLLDLEIVM